MNLTSHILHTFGMTALTIVILAIAVFLIAVAVSNMMGEPSDLEG